ncbi:hypothetical protein FACS1894151_02230 [Spirochaetia bacterium]|nr:hypothetical protein FACS1894151_02230 [Spirochaetia bacterium]
MAEKGFVESGFLDITVTSLDRDALAFQLNELNSRHIFIDSSFYTGVTPYMVDELLIKFSGMKIHIVNFGDFPDSLAVRFIFHGAQSCLDFRDCSEEFRKSLGMVYSGDGYKSPGVG